MTIRQTFLISGVVSMLHAQAGTPELVAPSSQSSDVFSFDVDFLRSALIQTGEMDLKKDAGDLSLTRFELRVILSEPISALEGLSIIPVVSYAATSLDFSGTAAVFPIEDEDLHAIALNTFFIQDIRNTPWFGLGWVRAEMATDFQSISGSDFDFDLAAGLGYRVNDKLTLGVGVAALSLNGDSSLLPGVGFDWLVSDQLRVGLYGPNFITSYRPDDNWEFSVRGEPNGGNWNIRDAAGRSRTIDLTSYRLGLHASRRIGGEFWLGAGVGTTLANEIELKNRSGGNRFSRDLDGSFFGQITLSLHRW